jgi:hypothetical protein
MSSRIAQAAAIAPNTKGRLDIHKLRLLQPCSFFLVSSVLESSGKLKVWKGVPQRLKPSSAQALFGTAEAVPFVRKSSLPLKGHGRLHVLSKFANLKI